MQRGRAFVRPLQALARAEAPSARSGLLVVALRRLAVTPGPTQPPLPASGSPEGSADALSLPAASGAGATTASSSAGADAAAVPGSQQPTDKYVMLYTCKVCETRQARQFTKHSYHHGVVIVRCGGCNNLHLIADHLSYFGDSPTTVADILRAQGEEIRQRSLDSGVAEFSEQDLAVLRAKNMTLGKADAPRRE